MGQLPAPTDQQQSPGLLAMLQNQLLSKLGGNSPQLPNQLSAEKKASGGHGAQYQDLLKQLQAR